MAKATATKTAAPASEKSGSTKSKQAATAAGANASVEARGGRIEVEGEVISDKMNKTISVLIYRLVRHKKYGKFMRRSSVFKAHDENNTAKIGDTVRIHQTRPLSKTKRWALTEIVKSATVTAGVKE